MTKLSVLLAAADEPWEVPVIRALQSPDSGMTLVRRCMDVADVVATATTGQADAVLLSSRLHGLDADILGRLLEVGTEPVLVTDPDRPSDSERINRLTRDSEGTVVSWREVTHLPALVHARASTRAEDDQSYDGPGGEFSDDEPSEALAGRLIAVWGPTGAPGRSTVAVGLAATCADRGLPTLLIDADVYGGAVAPMLAVLDEVSGVLAAARLASTGSLDLAALHQHVRELSPYLRVLTGLPRADRWPQLRPSALAPMLRVAREMAPLVVVDCGFCLEQDEDLVYDVAAPRRNGATLLTLERADLVLAVGTADPLGLTRLARGVLDLREAVPGVEVSVVVNRLRSGLGWSREQVAQVLHRFTGENPAGYLPEDRDAVDRAAVEGKTLVECARGSPLALALDSLAVEVVGVPAGTRRRRLRLRR